MKLSATCLKIQEEEGRAGRKTLSNSEQVECEGSEKGKLGCLERTSTLIENFSWSYRNYASIFHIIRRDAPLSGTLLRKLHI